MPTIPSKYGIPTHQGVYFGSFMLPSSAVPIDLKSTCCCVYVSRL